MPRRLLPLLAALAATLGVPVTAHGFIPPDVYGPAFVDHTDRPDVARRTTSARSGLHTTTTTTWYAAWNGRVRTMKIVHPRRPAAGRRLPLVIWAHGAGGSARCENSFRDLPGRFGFVVACIDGQGTATRGHSYAAPGQIDDLARVPDLVRQRLPRLRIDQRNVIIAGTSMGGIEALVAADRHPTRFRSVVAIDAIADMQRRYWSLPTVRQRALREECGGDPIDRPACFARRTPIANIGNLARSRTRIALYWSVDDRLSGSTAQMPAYAMAIHTANPDRRFSIRIGTWRHGRAWNPRTLDVEWLVDQGLLPERLRDRGRNRGGWSMEVTRRADLRALPIAR